MVNLEWYRTFKKIYENGTLTKAAKALFTSQPGVSLHLNALESYVGKKLFERTSRKMIPTEDGKFLYEYIVASIENLEIAEQHFKKTTQEKNPSLHIGMCSEMFQHVIEPEIPTLNFDLIAKFGAHIDLIKDLNNGLLDLVVTAKKITEKGSVVNYTPFAKEKIVLIAGINTDTENIKSHIKTKDWSALEESLQQNTWYSASNDMEHFREFWFNNFNKKPCFKPNYILPNIASIIRCLTVGKGLALVPDFLCEEMLAHQKIKLVWKGKNPTENIFYFASRTDLKHKKEVSLLENLFISKMELKK